MYITYQVMTLEYKIIADFSIAEVSNFHFGNNSLENRALTPCGHFCWLFAAWVG